MALPLSPPIEQPPGRGILRRLHRDTRGLASTEFVLSAPVIVLIAVFLGHANKISVKRIDTMREVRTAAFAKANGLNCTADMSIARLVEVPAVQPLPGTPITGDGIECEMRAAHEGAGEDGRSSIWDDMNAIAKDKGATSDLAGELADEQPQLVTAHAARLYRYNKRAWLKPHTWRDSFTVDDSTLFVSDKEVTQRGYDPTLREAVAGASDGAGELFDGIFPGAGDKQ